MRPCVLGLPADRSGVWGQVQDWLQARGVGVYEPHRRYGEGTLFNEWNGTAFGFRPETVQMLRKVKEPMMWHVGSYYYASKPVILRRALPMLWAMREALREMGVEHPWLLVDEPPHAERYGWTQTIEDDVVAFVGAAQSAGWLVGVAVPGPSQYDFWRQRIQPGRWVLHAKHEWSVSGDVWLYNAETVEGLGARLAAAGASGYLQWSAIKTTKQGPVPILFDEAGQPTDSGLRLVTELDYVAPAPNVEERVTALGEKVKALEAKMAALEAKMAGCESAGGEDESGTAPQAALFYSSSVADWRREVGRLSAYGRAVINAEMATAVANSQGEAYVEGGAIRESPLRYLMGQGVDVWLYVSPWWIWTAGTLSGPGEQLRQAQRETAEATGAWLLDGEGKRVTAYDGKMTVVNARSESYRRWLALTLLQLPHDRIFVDQAWPHQTGYHGGAVSDAAWVEAASDLYRTLRAGGKRVMLNGGWEFDESNGRRSYPLREVCDGVAIEAPGGFRLNGAWWQVWEPGKREMTRLGEVAAAWKGMGKEVMIVARALPAATLATERMYWRAQAGRLGVSWACQVNWTTIPEAAT